jgi:hypothetical protein
MQAPEGLVPASHPLITGDNMKWLPAVILALAIGMVATPGYTQTPVTPPPKNNAKAEKTKAKAASKEPKSNKKMSTGEGAAYAGAYAKGVPQGQPVAPK